MHDLEEENERCVNDLSKLEKALDKYKIENTELKSKVILIRSCFYLMRA